jgi:hypothetical protein
MAADCVRIERMLYFGRDFLCGLDPPVLKLKFSGPSLSEYVSVVDSSSSASSCSSSAKNGPPHLLVSFQPSKLFLSFLSSFSTQIYSHRLTRPGFSGRPSPTLFFPPHPHREVEVD